MTHAYGTLHYSNYFNRIGKKNLIVKNFRYGHNGMHIISTRIILNRLQYDNMYWIFRTKSIKKRVGN